MSILPINTPKLGDMFVRGVIVVLVLVVLAQIAFGWITGMRADYWKGEAETARGAATTAQANANSANAGAMNATQTRTNIDAGTFTVRVATEQSAQRIESYVDRPIAPADLDPIDPDVMRELEGAEDRARAAANRLQRKGAR